jgi:hypothetical protein
MLYCRYGTAHYGRRSISNLAPEIYTTGEVIGMGTYEFLTTLVLLLALIIAIKS